MKTVIFDFDGTVADTLDLTIQIFNDVAKEFHLPNIQPEDIGFLRDFSARELVKKYQLSPWQLFRLVRSMQSRQKKEIASARMITGMDTVFNMLEKHKISVGIVTSNSCENVHLFLETHGIHTVAFVHSENNIFGKGIVLKKLLKNTAILAEDAYYVGDEVRDIDAGHHAGMRVVAVTWGFNSRKRLLEACPDSIVDTPEQLWEEIC